MKILNRFIKWVKSLFSKKEVILVPFEDKTLTKEELVEKLKEEGKEKLISQIESWEDAVGDYPYRTFSDGSHNNIVFLTALLRGERTERSDFIAKKCKKL